MINKSTEYITNKLVLKSLIKEFNLNVGFIEWQGVKVPHFFNEYSIMNIYIENGWLDLHIFNIKNFTWCRSPIDNYIPERISHKDFFNSIIEKVELDEILSKENNEHLHYFIHFLLEFLPEIFVGDFSKINKFMEPMQESQIKEIKEFLNNELGR